MKNTLKIIISILLILILTSCESESNYDINELLSELNEKYEYDFQYEDFTIIKNKNYVYSTIVDKKLLLTLYCNNNCEIEQCTLTGEENSELFNNLYRQIASILIGDINYKDIDDSQYGYWCIKKIINKSGISVIINRSSNKIHDNYYPKLK